MTRQLMLLVFVIVTLGMVTSSNASIVAYTATLNGANEAPPNGSLGTGFTTVTYDDIAHTLKIDVIFSGLTGRTTVAHIHSATAVAGTGTAGVATTTPTFAGFPSGVTSGTYSNTLDLTLTSSWNASFIAAHGGTTSGAEASFVASLAAGKNYLNIHTVAVPGGEIRGFLQPQQTVPEPATFGLWAVGALGLAFAQHVRRRRGHRAS